MPVYGPQTAYVPIQRALQFFDAVPHSDADRLAVVDPNSPKSYFSEFIGNRQALQLLSMSAYSAMADKFHNCGDASFALLGPSSAGKTTLAKLFAKVVGLPFVELQPQQLDSVEAVLVAIARVLENTWVDTPEGRVNLELVDQGDNTFEIPPCVVFIDEVHALKKRIFNGLLKATEPKDRMLVTESGWKADTSAVCWIIATTEVGNLHEAFLNRFEPIVLNLYSAEEIAQMVARNYPKYPAELAAWTAFYCGQVPREAIRFAKKVIKFNEMYGGTWAESAWQCAQYYKIDKFGMTEQRVKVLTLLGQTGPIAGPRLPAQLGIKAPELRKYTLPPMESITADQPEPLICVSAQGYTITPAGLAELDKRGIKHLGKDALAPQMRGKVA